MSTLGTAIALAAKAHEGQVDKAGQSYILHPIRVMLAQSSDAARMVAVMHDVVEDCGVTLDDLRAHGFSDDVISGVDAVTKRAGESYEDFVLRAGRHPLGRPVKIADLLDNSDLRRFDAPEAKDFARLERYRRALLALGAPPPSP